MRTNRIEIGMLAALVVAIAATAAPTAAQTPARPLLSSPDAVRACLCQEFAVETLSAEMATRQRMYEDVRSEIQGLDAEIAARRAQGPMTSQPEIDAFRLLLERRDDAAQRLAGRAQPDYSASVEAYNLQVARFNAGCGNSLYDADVLAAVRSGLVCPPP